MKSKKRVLIIGNHPIKNPLHGGQKRTAAVVHEYRKAFAEVKFVAAFSREQYPAYDVDDIYLTGEWARRVQHDHLTSDIAIAHAMTESEDFHRKLINLLDAYRPDIIQVEQIFPYIGLRHLIAELGITPKIILNSQNIEATLKRDIMRIAGAPADSIKQAVAEIDEVESYLASHADVVAAVSLEDGEYFLRKGARSYVLAANGISKMPVMQSGVEYWRKLLDKDSVKRTAVFVGSAHMPNMQGFAAMVGLRLGFIPADARLILGGGVGKHIHDNFDYGDIQNGTFWRRAINGGILTEEQLSGLLHIADVVILPILKGGGSNLKTAEAILSGKKIVATSFAFRGYEQYINLSGVHIADTPAKFHEAIAQALSSPAINRTKPENQLAEKVQWKYSLSDLVAAAGKL